MLCFLACHATIQMLKCGEMIEMIRSQSGLGVDI